MSINTMYRRILRRYGIAGSEPLFEPEELVGRRFGDKKQYFVENAIGDGGNSIVFRGRSIGTAETVAIKVLRTPQSVDKDELLKEYEAFQDLLHQNLLVLMLIALKSRWHKSNVPVKSLVPLFVNHYKVLLGKSLCLMAI